VYFFILGNDQRGHIYKLHGDLRGVKFISHDPCYALVRGGKGVFPMTRKYWPHYLSWGAGGYLAVCDVGLTLAILSLWMCWGG
jgi:hypothetical protein